MRIDFNAISESVVSDMHGGTGEITAKVFEGDGLKVVPCRIHPGGSIGTHSHGDGIEISYVLYGTGVARCDGKEEPLYTDVCHVCPKDSEHSITNTGMTDLVILTVAAKG